MLPVNPRFWVKGRRRNMLKVSKKLLLANCDFSLAKGSADIITSQSSDRPPKPIAESFWQKGSAGIPVNPWRTIHQGIQHSGQLQQLPTKLVAAAAVNFCQQGKAKSKIFGSSRSFLQFLKSGPPASFRVNLSLIALPMPTG